MIAPDTSVVIAALAPWHTEHEAARTALARSPARLVGHVAFETTSALSRMPEGRRIAAAVVLEALERRFPDAWLQLGSSEVAQGLRKAVDAGIRGGALYDALVAVTAVAHGATVLTADRRAIATYDAVGATAEQLV